MFTKICEVKLNAVEEHLERLVQESDAWASGLACGKNFAAKYRTYSRGRKAKISADLYHSLQSLLAFFKKEETELGSPHPTLRLFCWKAAFFQPCTDNRLTGQRFRDIVDDDLAATFEELPQVSRKVEAERWVRSLIISDLADTYEAMYLDSLDDLRPRLLQDLTELMETLQVLDTSGMLATLKHDIKMLHVVMSIDVDKGHSVAVAIEARKHIQECARMAQLKRAFNSGVGSELFVPLTNFLNRSSNDNLGDSRLTDAVTCFTDSNMFRVQASSDNTLKKSTYVIINASLCFEKPMPLKAVLTEAMTLAFEATRLWSPMRFTEKSDEFADFLAKVEGTVVHTDLALAAKMYSATAEFFSLMQKCGDDADALSALAEGIPLSVMPMLGNLDGHLDGVEAQVKKLVSNMTSRVDVCGDDRTWSRTRQNHHLRNMICQAFTAIAGMASIPHDADSQIEEWLTRGACSTLTNMISLKKLAKELRPFDLGWHEDDQRFDADATVRLQDGPPTDQPENEYPAHDIQNMPLLLTSSAFAKLAHAAVSNCVANVFDKLGASMEIAGLQCTPCEDILQEAMASNSMQRVMALFVNADLMPMTVKDVVLCVNSSTGPADDGLVLQSARLITLLDDLIDNACQESDEITLSGAWLHLAGTCAVHDALIAAKLQQAAHEVAAAFVWISVTAANAGCAVLAFKLNPKFEVVLDFGLKKSGK